MFFQEYILLETISTIYHLSVFFSNTDFDLKKGQLEIIQLISVKIWMNRYIYDYIIL